MSKNRIDPPEQNKEKDREELIRRLGHLLARYWIREAAQKKEKNGLVIIKEKKDIPL